MDVDVARGAARVSFRQHEIRDLVTQRRRVRAGVVAPHGDGHMLVGIAREECSIAGRRSVVADLADSLIVVDDESERVGDRASARQTHARLHRVDERLAADGRMIEVLVPAHQIAHRAEQTAVADHVRERHVGVISGLRAAVVRRRAIGHDRGEVVAPLRVRHAERTEEALLRELVERLAAHALAR